MAVRKFCGIGSAANRQHSMIELILGGARSGKSRLAEQRAQGTGLPVTYIATATACDDEMAARIAHHRAQRPDHWQLIEEPLQLAEAIEQISPQQCILVDCLTLWVSNWLLQESPQAFDQAKQTLLATLTATRHHVILVGNETGMGVIPLGTLSRDFVDQSGWLHQDIAQLADTVVLSVAGLPLPLKQQGKNCFTL